MRLADDDVMVMIGSERFTLRPTLRAATRLERLLDGYEALCARILAGNLTLIITIIIETNATPITAAQIHNLLKGQPLGEHMQALTVAALNIVAKLAGHDADAPGSSPADGGRMSYRDLHKELFRIAAGNFGWSPDQAWKATPAEILEAYRGRNDLLRSIFGCSEQESTDAQTAPSASDVNAQLDRAGLDKLRGRGRLS